MSINICPPINLFDAVNNHINVYQGAGLSPPPYRATRAEIKAVWSSLKRMLPHTDKDVHYDDIRQLMGVDIEVVTIG